MKDIAKTTNKIPLGPSANAQDKLQANRDDIVYKYGFYSQFKDYLEIKCNDRINFE